MSPVTAIRYAVSYAASAGALLCLTQVPGIWAKQAASLAYQPSDVTLVMQEFTVVLDAGHGGIDGGTQGEGILEKNLSLAITRRVEKHLAAAGIRTLMTRRDDTYVALEKRADFSNRHQPDAFVSIHLNADATTGNTSGLETYYCSRKRLGDMMRLRERLDLPKDEAIRDRRSEWLADILHKGIQATTGAENRGTRDSNYLVVMNTECPAVLIECGYLTNTAEARRLEDEAYQEKIAAAITDGLRRFLLASRMNPRRGIERNALAVAMPGPALEDGNP
ncbi:N-acetylmuramoyl-L-alanine amidase [Roseimicrobium gellanilyticum]|uniref:N-acetylmuramoyl-L-alanine amidase n=1 Tax=Roseimicrobium gellanilyticum TaxID=748857 RepID=A0A366HUQ1_9BACT|nr:N-acetylmuramoyl-L-alanine amidase [Roseimicrobium gellanilyticum]RBP47409.1 N-acetylmuramoyl-L-alanine amidase [Roseimicrobium gellanilyticum]